MNVTLFGCYYHFDELEINDGRAYRTLMQSILARFVQTAKTAGLSEMSVMDESDLHVNSESIPIASFYFVEITILVADGEQVPDDYTLQGVVVALGDLWDEFIRTGIDSGGFVGIRLECGIKQFKWSAEGRNYTTKTEGIQVNQNG